jgi:hypothetical protein
MQWLYRIEGRLRYRTLHDSLMGLIDDFQDCLHGIRGAHNILRKWFLVSHIVRAIRL